MTPNRTQQTLVNLQEEETISTGQVVICLIIPLSKTRFLAEKGGVAWWGRLFSHSPDFARNFSETFAEPYWHGEDGTGYEQRVVLPVLQSLLEVSENTQASIVPDCTFARLKSLLDNQVYRLLILVAHHYEERIDFAGGSVKLPAVQKLFSKNSNRMSLCLLVCESESAGMSIKDRGAIRSLGSSPYELSVVHAARFITCWLKAMDGSNTISQAYHRAIHQYLNSSI